MDSQQSQNVKDQDIVHSKRTFKRLFIFLDKYEPKAPSGKKLEALQKGNQVAEITFTRNHSASAIGRLLLATFPSLLGVDLQSLTFLKSYQSGHAMATVKKGLISGNEIVNEYSSSHKKKIFFMSVQPGTSTVTTTSASTPTQAAANITQVDLTTIQSPPTDGPSTRRLLTAMAHNSKSTDDKDCVIFSSGSSSSSVKPKDLVQVLAEEPEVVGTVAEELGYFGLPSKKKKKPQQGRTEEVATSIETLVSITGGNLPPFLSHTLDELLWQAREDGAICILKLFSDRLPVCEGTKAYLRYAFKLFTQETEKIHCKVLYWLADSQSNEGTKVQAKYGVGGQSSILILVPSHVPQCVEILNEANFDQKRLADALHNASELSKIIQRERQALNSRRQLLEMEERDLDMDQQVTISNEEERAIGETDSCNSEKEEPHVEVEISQEAEITVTADHLEKTETAPASPPDELQHGTEKAEIRNDGEKDTEVTFGPVSPSQDDNLDKTVEDEVDEGLVKKGKNKKKKKKNKKNKKRKAQQEQNIDLGESEEKKQKVQ